VSVTAHDLILWLAPELAGDGQAYQQYASRLIRDLESYFAGRGCTEAKDLAAEVLSRMVEKLAQGEPPGRDSDQSRKKHVFGFARNVLREWKRNPGRREVPLDDGDDAQMSVDEFDLIGEECRRLFVAVVREHLSELSPAEQEVLIATVLNPDYSPVLNKLAVETGRNPAALRQRVSRASRRLRDLVSKSSRRDDLQRCLGSNRGAA